MYNVSAKLQNSLFGRCWLHLLGTDVILTKVKVFSYGLGFFIRANSPKCLAHGVDDLLTAVAEDPVCLPISSHDGINIALKLAADLVRVLVVVQSMNKVIYERLYLHQRL